MKVFTTINPYGNFDAQYEALKSWSDRYEVFSVNIREEIDIVKEKYPFVKFIETDKIFEYSGKKLIKLNSILSVIRKEFGDCAIVNSDIILDKKISYDKKILKNGIIIANRWEIGNESESYPFNNGYDLFIFNSKHAELFMNDKYVIGMPWWDFWIPSIAIKAGMDLYHINKPVILHRTHETNYDSNTWISFGEYLYNDLMINLMKNNMDIDIWSFCNGVKKFIEKNQKVLKLK